MSNSIESIFTKFLKNTKTADQWRFVQASFLNALNTELNVALDTKLDITFDPTLEPTLRNEATAMAFFNFFDGHFLRVVGEEDFNDTLMKELMIEASHSLKDWLTMKTLLQGRHRAFYHAFANYLSFKHSEKLNSASLVSEEIPWDKLPETTTHYYSLLGTLLPENSDSFILSLVSILQVGAPIGFDENQPVSPQREANVLTAYTFRNTSLEDIHAGSPVTEETVASLQLESITKLQEWLHFFKKFNKGSKMYRTLFNCYWSQYCSNWQE
jgi:hypothetical protein